METINLHDLTNRIVTPETVKKLARTAPVIFDRASLTTCEIARWREVLQHKDFLALVAKPKTDTWNEVIFYTGDYYTPEEIYKAVKTRGDFIEVNVQAEIRLPIRNFGTISFFSREVNAPEIREFAALVGNITPNPTRIWAELSEWRPHITVGNKIMAVNLPKIKGSYQHMAIDNATGALVCLTTDGYYIGMVNADATVRWGDINTPLTEKFIEDVYATYTRTTTRQ